MPVPQVYLDLLAELGDTFRRKNAGYAGKANNWDQNFRVVERIGVPIEDGLMVRLCDKWERLCNLWDRPDLDQVDEALDDTLLDLVNYGLILLTVRREAAAAAAQPKPTELPELITPNFRDLVKHDWHGVLSRHNARPWVGEE